MRRRAGIGAIHKKKLDAEKFKEKGNELAEHQLTELSGQLQNFQTNLENFAREHKQDIKRDPEFRRHFQEMCASIGVDPLASGKGFWSNMLDIGDFYYELGVQIVEVCMASQHKTGGLMELGEIRHKLIRSRGRSEHHQDITLDDLLRATKKLKVLGTGFTVISLGSGRHLVQSVPGEMSLDQVNFVTMWGFYDLISAWQVMVLQHAEASGGMVNQRTLKEKLNWDKNRSTMALEKMLGAGLLWVDKQGEEGDMYWVPSIFTSQFEN